MMKVGFLASTLGPLLFIPCCECVCDGGGRINYWEDMREVESSVGRLLSKGNEEAFALFDSERQSLSSVQHAMRYKKELYS